ncbi:MAG: hypothetical protein LBN02_04185, partial [Oscillospiraceae bacterium]|nr:hypothetical protein [Oscillospiraceae bacterium]
MSGNATTNKCPAVIRARRAEVRVFCAKAVLPLYSCNLLSVFGQIYETETVKAVSFDVGEIILYRMADTLKRPKITAKLAALL